MKILEFHLVDKSRITLQIGRELTASSHTAAVVAAASHATTIVSTTGCAYVHFAGS
jgi:hypothetical protein